MRPEQAFVRRAVGVGCALLLVLAMASVGTAAQDAFPSVASAYLVKVQNQTVWAKGPTKRLPPASLTKIMTALLVLDAYRPHDVVAIGPAAAAEPGTRLGLHAGDRMTVEDLLAAMLLSSANDACHALADWLAGDEARFARLMNRRARELGLADTQFANACGLDAPGHYSSARDLALLTEVALRQPIFAELVAKRKAHLHSADGYRQFAIENRNALIGRFPEVKGVKSGYTSKAGKCLVAVAERAGVRVLIVLLNAPDQWWHAHAMFERAFSWAAERRGV
jgi:D-alanyl-D-alanine carboxypeptidase (penicillin-binding protein 5/6)